MIEIADFVWYFSGIWRHWTVQSVRHWGGNPRGPHQGMVSIQLSLCLWFSVFWIKKHVLLASPWYTTFLVHSLLMIYPCDQWVSLWPFNVYGSVCLSVGLWMSGTMWTSLTVSVRSRVTKRRWQSRVDTTATSGDCTMMWMMWHLLGNPWWTLNSVVGQVSVNTTNSVITLLLLTNWLSELSYRFLYLFYRYFFLFEIHLQ